ncbi:MAG: nucleoside kinase [Clostridia bacterium]|nr:nucleoside kinase [Clostridia bacterium]
MRLTIKQFKSKESFVIDAEAGITPEMIYKEHKDYFTYPIICCKVNNHLRDLTFPIKEDALVEMLDAREDNANRIMQESLSLIYIRACKKVLGDDARISIRNILSDSLFTTIKPFAEVTEEQVAEIEKLMHEYCENKTPIEYELMPREKALAKLKETNYFYEKIKLLEYNTDFKNVVFYTFDGYTEPFYFYMVPSADYVSMFELKKYRHGVLLRCPRRTNPNELPPFAEEPHMYETFGTGIVWRNKLAIKYAGDLNEEIVNGDPKELIMVAEALQEKKIVDIADEVYERKSKVVLIAGPSSSGKTSFAKRLCVQLRALGLKPIYMGTDDFFKNRYLMPKDEEGEYNFEDLDALDVDLFKTCISDLLEGKEVDMPRFDFITGVKVFGEKKLKIKSNQILVIEGIHALNDDLTGVIPKDKKYRIYISPLSYINVDKHTRTQASSARVIRRIVRDYKTRGYSAKETIKIWPKVREAEARNIFPYSENCDIIFDSALIYELPVLKKHAMPLLETIKIEDDEYCEARALIRTLKFIEEIHDDTPVPNDSLLREFIGGSVIV